MSVLQNRCQVISITDPFSDKSEQILQEHVRSCTGPSRSEKHIWSILLDFSESPPYLRIRWGRKGRNGGCIRYNNKLSEKSTTLCHSSMCLLLILRDIYNLCLTWKSDIIARWKSYLEGWGGMKKTSAPSQKLAEKFQQTESDMLQDWLLKNLCLDRDVLMKDELIARSSVWHLMCMTALLYEVDKHMPSVCTAINHLRSEVASSVYSKQWAGMLSYFSPLARIHCSGCATTVSPTQSPPVPHYVIRPVCSAGVLLQLYNR